MKTKTNLIYLFIATIILIASASGYYYLSFTYNGLKDEIDFLSSTSIHNKERIAELRQIEADLQTTIAKRDRLALLFVKQDAIVDFISQIESLMKSQKLAGSIDTVAEDHPSELDGTGMERLDISLSASGSWAGALGFLGQLENLPYKSGVDAVTFNYGMPNSVNDKGGASVWNISVQMHALAGAPAQSAQTKQ